MLSAVVSQHWGGHQRTAGVKLLLGRSFSVLLALSRPNPACSLRRQLCNCLLAVLLCLLPCLSSPCVQVMADSRQQVDAVISCAIKGLISVLPLLAHCSSCEYVIVQLLAAPARQWNLPTTHLLAAAVAAGLPLYAVLLNSGGYAGVRDSVLAATQGLLFVMLRKPLLLAAASGSAAAAAVSVGVASGGVAPSTPLFHGCVGALLLLLLRQRLCWALWQASSDAALGLVLLCWECLSAAAPVPPMCSCLGSLLHVLLPLLALPMLYLREKVDRWVLRRLILTAGYDVRVCLLHFDCTLQVHPHTGIVSRHACGKLYSTHLLTPPAVCCALSLLGVRRQMALASVLRQKHAEQFASAKLHTA